MVSTIIPIVYGRKSAHSSAKWRSVIWLHAFSCAIGGATFGGAVALLGSLLPWRIVLIRHEVLVLVPTGILSMLYAAHELGLIRVPVPQSRWQVPRSWRTLSPPIAAAAYGFPLGLGVMTGIPVGTFYVAAIWTFLVGDPLLGAISMGIYGMGRGFPIVWLARALRSAEDTDRVSRMLLSCRPGMHYLNGLILGFVGTCLLVGVCA